MLHGTPVMGACPLKFQQHIHRQRVGSKLFRIHHLLSHHAHLLAAMSPELKWMYTKARPTAVTKRSKISTGSAAAPGSYPFFKVSTRSHEQ